MESASTSTGKHKVEVCFSPALYQYYSKPDAVVVIVDILRASSAICAAFMNGASKIIPVETLDEAKRMKEMGYIVAAERDGIIQDFADFGNSPFNFTYENVRDKEVVYSTTNGTQCVHLAASAYKVLIAAFLNISSVKDFLFKTNRDILILCAGWKNKFSLEDSFFAGALVEKLIFSGGFYTVCDAALACVDLWQTGKDDPLGYIEKAAQRHRLRLNKLDDVLEFCHTPDLTEIIPVLEKDYLVPLRRKPG
jgi:2-phosphosulfolactate phosphatase